MKVIALLSGGKDSCYTILKCRLHGHEIVAIGHITPPEEEADSFMYQSVASNAVSYIAEALDVQLFTQPTNAISRLRELSYTPTPGDEVEDLTQLLERVKAEIPDVQAVCAGALWSDYQRLRVESSASRVGLLSLAYLWRREQSDLLDEMISIGLHAVLVKVAGAGLDSRHLGKSLKEMRPTLRKLESLYGSHVCGEGGEYETLVLWMPGFKKRLSLDEVEIVEHSKDPVAPVSFLRIAKCSLVEITNEQRILCSTLVEPQKPAVFQIQEESCEFPEVRDMPANDSCKEMETTVSTAKSFSYICVKSVKEGGEGVTDAGRKLKDLLNAMGEGLGSVVYVTLHLRSVSGEKYAQANVGYNKVFAGPECTPPPSRSCVGTFATNHATTVEAIVRRKRDRREMESFTLHVQSLSEWAPPCIGPYAQFVEEDGVLHVCGVLPLYAPTASILPGMTIKAQVEACFYNLTSTLEASHAEISSIGFFTAYVVAPELVNPVNEEMKRLITYEKHIVLVLPVKELPKGGLVEIRSTGVVQEAELVKPDEDVFEARSGLDVKRNVVQCAKLGFVTVTLQEGLKNIDIAGEIQASIKMSGNGAFGNAEILSLQVYSSLEDATLEAHVRRLMPDAGVTVSRSPWLPNQAQVIAVVTFVL